MEDNLKIQVAHHLNIESYMYYLIFMVIHETNVVHYFDQLSYVLHAVMIMYQILQMNFSTFNYHLNTIAFT